MSDTLVDNFRRYALHYELFNRNKDYVAEVGYLCRLVSAYAPASRSILELGCGTGTHARLLKERGFEVLGIERSPEMALKAQKSGVDVLVGDITQVSTDRSFDLVFSLFHVISYLTTWEELEKTFSLTAQHLNAGGLFIFDVWHTPAVENQRPEVRERRVKYEGGELVRVARPREIREKKIVEVTYGFSTYDVDGHLVDQWEEVHPMRHFTQSEIVDLAIGSGLELVSSEEYLTGSGPSVDSWGVCYILRKKEIL